MPVAIFIKISIVLTGILLIVLASTTLKKRTNSILFTGIWILAGIILIITGIFIEPYNWLSIMGVPTIVLLWLLGIAIVILFWYLTKKIDDLQHKFNDMSIQLSLVKDKNSELNSKLDEANKTIAKNKKEIQFLKDNSLQMFTNNNFLSDKNIHNKDILFVNNTLSTGGAEKLLLQTLQMFVNHGNNVHLYVMTGMGELIDKIPAGVKVLNKKFDSTSVLSDEGKKKLKSKVINAETTKLTGFKLAGYTFRAFTNMIKSGEFRAEKLVWRAIAETAPIIKKHYDLAIAFTEGASTYYVADRVSANHKIAFVHISYGKAGYTKQLDKNSYDSIDEILTVSKEVRDSFLKVHPECLDKTRIHEYKVEKETINNLSNVEFEKSIPWDLSDHSHEIKKRKVGRILTVSRLVAQKSYFLVIEAAKILMDRGYNFQWIALGEGEDRNILQQTINEYGLQDKFILLGNVLNPYPYMKHCDVYVHATKFEGKSISIQEAKALGCAVVVSDVPGNQDQIIDGENGLFCNLNANDIADKVAYLLDNPDVADKLGQQAQSSL